jgi:hypothetical protein
MLYSFPVLCLLLLCYVHVVVAVGRTKIRPHQVTYRPIKNLVMDWLLIFRLGCANLPVLLHCSGRKPARR